MKKMLGFGVAMALVAAPAFALTSVEDPWNEGFPTDELNLYEIYNSIYGTDFGSTDGATDGGLSTGGMDGLRVEPDQIFEYAEDGVAQFLARYAGRNQTFGYYTDLNGGPTYVPLFTSNAPAQNQIITNNTDNVTYHVGEFGGFVTLPAADSPIGFYDYNVRQTDPTVPLLWHSENGRNFDGEDHMVAFYGLVEVAEDVWVVDTTTILVAFEDHPGLEPDHDYNDLVVEVRFPGGFTPNDPVAEPATAGILLLGLAGAALRRRFTA